MKFWSEFIHLHSRKCIWKYRLRNGVHCLGLNVFWMWKKWGCHNRCLFPNPYCLYLQHVRSRLFPLTLWFVVYCKLRLKFKYGTKGQLPSLYSLFHRELMYDNHWVIFYQINNRCQFQTHISFVFLCFTIIQLISPGQNGRHFADDTFRYIFVNEKFCILIKKFTEVCFQESNWQ